MKLVGRDFIGTIVEVGGNENIGWYKVEIPELLHLSGKKGIIVVDESNKYWYTNSKTGTYGSFLPLQEGTKVVVRFKNNNLNSGYIDRIFSYNIPDSAKQNHPLHFLILQTPARNILYADDKSKELNIEYLGGKGKIKFTPSTFYIQFDGKTIFESSGEIFIRGAKIHLNDTAPSISSGDINVSSSIKNFPVKLKSSIAVSIEKISKISSPKVSIEKNEVVVTEIKSSTTNVVEKTDDSADESYSNISDAISKELESNNLIIVEEFFYYESIDEFKKANENIYTSVNNSLLAALTYRQNIIQKSNDILLNDLPVDKAVLEKTYSEHLKNLNNLYTSPEYQSLTEEEKELLNEKLSIINDDTLYAYSMTKSLKSYIGDTSSTTPPFNYDDSTTLPDTTFDIYISIYDYFVLDSNYSFAQQSKLICENNYTAINDHLDIICSLSNIRYYLNDIQNNCKTASVEDTINDLETLKKEVESNKGISTPKYISIVKNKTQNIVASSNLLNISNLIVNKSTIITNKSKSLNNYSKYSSAHKSFFNDLSESVESLNVNILELQNSLNNIENILKSDISNYNDLYSLIDNTIKNVYNISKSLSSISSICEEIDQKIFNFANLILKVWDCLTRQKVNDDLNNLNIDVPQTVYDLPALKQSNSSKDKLENILKTSNVIDEKVNDNYLKCIKFYNLNDLSNTASSFSSDISPYIDKIIGSYTQLLGILNYLDNKYGLTAIEMSSSDALLKLLSANAISLNKDVVKLMTNELSSIKKTLSVLDSINVPEVNRFKSFLFKSFGFMSSLKNIDTNVSPQKNPPIIKSKDKVIKFTKKTYEDILGELKC